VLLDSVTRRRLQSSPPRDVIEQVRPTLDRRSTAEAKEEEEEEEAEAAAAASKTTLSTTAN